MSRRRKGHATITDAECFLEVEIDDDQGTMENKVFYLSGTVNFDPDTWEEPGTCEIDIVQIEDEDGNISEYGPDWSQHHEALMDAMWRAYNGGRGG